MAEFTGEIEAGALKSSVHSAPVRAVLDRLHGEAGKQTLNFVGLGVGMARDKLLGRTGSLFREVERLRDLYVPVSRKQGAVVLADNIFTFRRALAPYVSYVQNPDNGFFSVTLFLGDGTEYSVRL
jgi:hypothetical protein